MHLNVLPAVVLMLAVAFAGMACAQDLSDPMRPYGYGSPAKNSEAKEGTEDALGAQLQSILIVGRHRVAVIDRQTAAVGDKVGAYRVIEISENTVKMQGEDGVTVLQLYQDIEKKTRPLGIGGVKPAMKSLESKS